MLTQRCLTFHLCVVSLVRTLELRRERHLSFVFAEESCAAVSYVIQRYPQRPAAAVSDPPFSPFAQRASRDDHRAVECMCTHLERAPCFHVEFLLLRITYSYLPCLEPILR